MVNAAVAQLAQPSGPLVSLRRATLRAEPVQPSAVRTKDAGVGGDLA
jgi:hypothetical protein